ncbi:MAG TPA: stalk domain-containing protein [Caldisericia bacterium]|nr:stalk domain-containing protein [Caldisericia bacterium]HPF48861.1 stalk domain-containing protein [Caldisericia bacterium]HPI83275.1 stalk domain-containing protein [Caldisericia bacterium]HPQ92502.1 stalk domain-containing protein [Caldisericia bacterium]HRV74400.1 stalk domain-containing protein [Caldisericia bacterium]
MSFRKFQSIVLATVLFAGVISIPVSSVDAVDFTYAGLVEQISSDSAIKHIETLSSDKFEGRMTGQKGAQLAADYVKGQFQQMGLVPGGDNNTYLQNFQTAVWYPVAPLTFRQVDEEGNTKKDFAFREDYNICVVSGSGEAKTEVVFAGFGITSTGTLEYDDYKDIDVEGKVVAIMRHAPGFVQAMFEEHPELQTHMYFTTKLSNAMKHGALGVILLENPKLPPNNRTNVYYKSVSGSWHDMPCVFMTEDGSNKLLAGDEITTNELFDKIDELKEPYSFELADFIIDYEVNIDYQSDADVFNVIGYIPSSDQFGKNSTLMLTAHYDHLGIDPNGDIYNGACDNASGVSGLLEVARVFTESNAKLKINLVFAALTGEEIGLVGADYLASNPIFPSDGLTVINMDMICGKPNSVRCSIDPGYETLLETIKRASKVVGGDLYVGGPSNNSDHAPFSNRGIPATFIFGGPGMMWHVPEDTIDHVDKSGLELISRVVGLATAYYTDPFYLYIEGSGDDVIMASSREYEIEGYTGKGATVYVGGRSTVASASGHFKLKVSLEDGDNKIKVTANKVGTGEKITRNLTINYEPRPKLDISIDMINFGYVSKETGNKKVTFEITNTGKGEISGTLTSCADWLEISPNKLEPFTTTVTATVLSDRVTEMGLNTCIITLDTDGGVAFIPVTAIKSPSPTVTVELTPGTESVTIAGSDVNILKSTSRIDGILYYSSNLLSMAFGVKHSFDANQLELTLGDKKAFLWPGSNVVVIGNTPHILENNVYLAEGDVLLPPDFLELLDIELTIEEKTHKLSWSFEELKLELLPTENSNIYLVQASKNVLCEASSDKDWLLVYPEQLTVEGASSELFVAIDDSKLTKGEKHTANLTVSAPGATKSIEISTTIPKTEREITVQIGEKNATIDGKTVELDSEPFIHIDTTMVPLRFIGEAFGADVEWLADTKTVRATLGKKLIEVQIGNITAKINGIETQLVRAPMIQKGRTFIPLRFISEAFGAQVDWIAETKTVVVIYDMAADKPQPSTDTNSVVIDWHKATAEKPAPTTSVDINNIGGGNLTITSVKVHGDKLSASVGKNQISLQPIFTENGKEGKSILEINTTGGILWLEVYSNIYPEKLVSFKCNNTFTWFIDGKTQTDACKLIDGLYAVNTSKLFDAIKGSYGYDKIGNMLTLVANGKKFQLHTLSGDYHIDGELVPWRFGFEVKNDGDVYISWAALSLAFGWEINPLAKLGGIEMKVGVEADAMLYSNWPSLDLVYSETTFSKKTTDFSCEMYPIANGKTYNSNADVPPYRLYCFFDTSDKSAEIIPFIQSIHERYDEDKLSAYLVAASIPTDSAVENFFAGNTTIANGLAQYSLESLTVPILYDDKGQVCQGFPGTTTPRVYIIDDSNKLVSWFPEFNKSQKLYLEQAIIKLTSNSGYVPPDVLTLTVGNRGGRIGSGTLTSRDMAISVLENSFESSPTNISVSFNPEAVKWTDKRYSTELLLLGKSNSQTIPVRCWNLQSDTMLSSYYHGSEVIRIDGITHNLPRQCEGGEEAFGPIGLVLDEIGADIINLPGGNIRFISGDNDVIVKLGEKVAKNNSIDVEFERAFEMSDGILYGPMKALAEFAGATLHMFGESIVVTAKKIKGSITEPVLRTNTDVIRFNNYASPSGGYRKAPDFNLPDYPKQGGTKTQLSKLVARDDVKLVVMDFWATWCPPCKAGMPYLEQIYRKYKDMGLVVLGITTDDVDDEYVFETLESDNLIQNGLKELGLDAITYPMVYDPWPERATWAAYEGRAIPRLVMVSKNMEWLHTKVGFSVFYTRNLEYRIRMQLGIEEDAKPPQLVIKNDGIGTLHGWVACSLDYIKPSVTDFATTDSTTVQFEIDNLRGAPNTPERGYVTITSNGGTKVIPIDFNPFVDKRSIKIVINTADGSVEYNDIKTDLEMPVRIVNGKPVIAADVLLGYLGGTLTPLPDGKRSVGHFETWDISVINGEKEILAGGYTFKTPVAPFIEGNHTFVAFETIGEIIGADDLELKAGKDKVRLEYTP